MARLFSSGREAAQRIPLRLAVSLSPANISDYLKSRILFKLRSQAISRVRSGRGYQRYLNTASSPDFLFPVIFFSLLCYLRESFGLAFVAACSRNEKLVREFEKFTLGHLLCRNSMSRLFYTICPCPYLHAPVCDDVRTLYDHPYICLSIYIYCICLSCVHVAYLKINTRHFSIKENK